MCRLFALISTDEELGDVAKKVFTFGLWSAESTTNNDGTGACLFVDNKDLIVKSYLRAQEFCFIEKYLDLLLKSSGRVFLGHTRNATAGTKINGKHRSANAHPFRYGNIVGAHNGVFGFSDDIIGTDKLGGAEIDSAIFFALLGEEVGNNTTITAENVNHVLNQFNSTSYSCWALNSLDKKWLYLIKGNLPISYIKSGPFTFIATASTDVSASLSFLKLLSIPAIWGYEEKTQPLVSENLYRVNTETGELEKLGQLVGKVASQKYGRSGYGYGYYDTEGILEEYEIGRRQQHMFSDNQADNLVTATKNQVVGKMLYSLMQQLQISWRELDILTDYMSTDIENITAKDIKEIYDMCPVISEEAKSARMSLWGKISLILAKQYKVVYTTDKYNFLYTMFGNIIVFPWLLIEEDNLKAILIRLESGGLDETNTA